MYALDYLKSKPEDFRCKDTEYYRDCLHYYPCQDYILKNNHSVNANSFTLSQERNNFQNGNKEFLSGSEDKSENIEIQPSTSDNPRKERRNEDKKTLERQSVKYNNLTNRKSLHSRSAPSLASKHQVSAKERNGNDRLESHYKKGNCLIEPSSKIHDKSEFFQLLHKKRNQEIKSGQITKNINDRKRQGARRKLKIPIKMLQMVEGDGRLPSRKKSVFDSVNEIKYLQEGRYCDETDHCSSYSESDIRNVPRNEQQMLNPDSQESLMPKHSLNDKVKHTSNTLRFSNYEEPGEVKKCKNRFTSDSFLRKELSDFKDFLMYRRNQQRQRTNRVPKFSTVCIPENFKSLKEMACVSRMEEHGKESRRQNLFIKSTPTHTIRRPKISDEVLWKQFGHNFKSYASTRRHSGGVIPRHISTEWMSQMGVVGDLLTVKDANDAFKKAAGPKITMNMSEYKEFLLTLTMKKKLPLYEIYRRMCGF